MKLEEIHDMWSQDCDVSIYNLSEEALKIPKMHNKYLRLFSDEKMMLKKMNYDLKQLVLIKYDYYRGVLPEEDLKEHGWEPVRIRILKSDIDKYLEADQDIIKTNLKISLQQEKVDTLEAIIKSINNRGFLIKSAIDFEKFKVGG
jgi:hypothetical protein